MKRPKSRTKLQRSREVRDAERLLGEVDARRDEIRSLMARARALRDESKRLIEGITTVRHAAVAMLERTARTLDHVPPSAPSAARVAAGRNRSRRATPGPAPAARARSRNPRGPRARRKRP